MAEFPIHIPSDAEIADALEGLEAILRLDETGEVDLAPYLTRLLLQLEETLAAAGTAGMTLAADSGAASSSKALRFDAEGRSTFDGPAPAIPPGARLTGM